MSDCGQSIKWLIDQCSTARVADYVLWCQVEWCKQSTLSLQVNLLWGNFGQGQLPNFALATKLQQYIHSQYIQISYVSKMTDLTATLQKNQDMFTSIRIHIHVTSN